VRVTIANEQHRTNAARLATGSFSDVPEGPLIPPPHPPRKTKRRMIEMIGHAFWTRTARMDQFGSGIFALTRLFRRYYRIPFKQLGEIR
jgi:hypothetical protein